MKKCIEVVWKFLLYVGLNENERAKSIRLTEYVTLKSF